MLKKENEHDMWLINNLITEATVWKMVWLQQKKKSWTIDWGSNKNDWKSRLLFEWKRRRTIAETNLTKERMI